MLQYDLLWYRGEEMCLQGERYRLAKDEHGYCLQQHRGVHASGQLDSFIDADCSGLSYCLSRFEEAGLPGSDSLGGIMGSLAH
jgi:hypothetical protein